MITYSHCSFNTVQKTLFGNNHEYFSNTLIMCHSQLEHLFGMEYSTFPIY